MKNEKWEMNKQKKGQNMSSKKRSNNCNNRSISDKRRTNSNDTAAVARNAATTATTAPSATLMHTSALRWCTVYAEVVHKCVAFKDHAEAIVS